MKNIVCFFVLTILFFTMCKKSVDPNSGERTHAGELQITNQMIIITTPEYVGSLTDYLAWKGERGLEVEVDITSAANGADAVKNKLQEKYENDGLTYIILIGDIDDVPSIMLSGSASDPSYALLDGDDIFGDAYISRISVNTVSELEQQLNKIMKYEQRLFDNYDWINHGVVASMDGFDGINHSNLIVTAMNNHPDYFTKVIKIMESDDTTTSAIKNAIENIGVSIIAHHGHGSEVAFASLRFSSSDVAALTNFGGPWPFIHGAACETGSFDRIGGNCLAEAFMKAGTINQPAGAIAFLGATTGMDPTACCLAQREAFINLYYTDNEQTIGELCYKATLYAMNNLDSDSAEHLYRRWHLFGDCSTILWKRIPIKISHIDPN